MILLNMLAFALCFAYCHNEYVKNGFTWKFYLFYFLGAANAGYFLGWLFRSA